MLNYIFITLLFLFLIYFFFNQTLILQNQYYNIKRYIIYKKEHYIETIFNVIFLLLSFIGCLFNKWFCFFYLLSFIGLIKNKTIKFRFSNRVIAFFIIFILLISLNISYFIISYNIYYLFLYNLLVYWISFIISSFIEKIKQLYYLNKAKKKLKLYKPTIIAITGSCGKTSCKNYIYELIKDTYKTCITPKSYNTLNGILLTINTKLKPFHKILIIEIGLDHKNSINKYLKHFSFDICVVTNIKNQHIKTFKSIENIAKEKTKLLFASKNYVIINKDDPYINKLSFKQKQISFSINDSNNDVYITNNKNNLLVKIYSNKYKVKSSLLGFHNFSNLALSIAVSKALDIKDDVIINKIPLIKNVNHRLSSYKDNNWLIIDDSYNSNFTGFINALDVLKQFDKFKVIITPGIIEQTNNETQDKLIANKIKEVADLIILINHPSIEKYIDDKLTFFSFKEAYAFLKENYFNNDLVILIENDLPDIYLK